MPSDIDAQLRLMLEGDDESSSDHADALPGLSKQLTGQHKLELKSAFFQRRLPLKTQVAIAIVCGSYWSDADFFLRAIEAIVFRVREPLSCEEGRALRELSIAFSVAVSTLRRNPDLPIGLALLASNERERRLVATRALLVGLGSRLGGEIGRGMLRELERE